MKWKRIIFNQHAMTLIELLVTLTLVVVVSTLLAAIFKEGLVSYDRTVSEADLQLSVRHQSDVIVEDIRLSKIAVIDGESYPQTQSEPAKLTLFTGTSESPETITYILDGTNIVRQVGSQPSEVVFKDVSNFNVSVNPQQLVTVKIAVNPATTHYQDSIEKNMVLQAKPRATLPTLSN